MSSIVEPPTGINPALPSSALAMTTTLMQVRREQKEAQKVYHLALTTLKEKCVALTAEITVLTAEIRILQGRLAATERLHSASLRAHASEIESYKSRVEELQDQLKAEKAGKKTAVETITKIIRNIPAPTTASGFMARQTKLLQDVLKFLESYFDASLPSS